MWIAVADAAKLGRGDKIEVTAGKITLLISNVDDEIFATSGLCTHARGPLAEGSLRGSIVTCPWHGSRFDVKTGTVVSGPASRPIQRFATKVENGKILVEVPT